MNLDKLKREAEDLKAEAQALGVTGPLPQDRDTKLTVEQLAEALYEGTPHLQNLAEKLARQHSKASALSFFSLMGPGVQGFWINIAKQLIDHASHWCENNGACCVLDDEESARLKTTPGD